MLIDRVTDARVPDREGRSTLRLKDGRVTALLPQAEGAAEDEAGEGASLSAGGRVVLPAFVDAHVHLDKAFLLDEAGPIAPGLTAAIDAVAHLREHVSLAEARAKAERAVDLLVRQGVTAARVHAEIDVTVGLDLVHMQRELADAVADRIELQLVAFPQRGLETKRAIDLLESSLAHGVHVVGGCPYVDTDPRRHIDLVFGLAERYHAPVDLHLDFSDDPGRSLLSIVADRVRAHGMQGRVAIGHVTTLAAMAPDAQAAAMDLLAQAGIALIVLPVTDLYLVGHGEPGTRSVAPLERARAAGVRVAIANNNLQNPFAPFGNGNLVQAAWLMGIMRRAVDAQARRWLLEAITTEPAAILGLGPHGPAEGAAAHLVVVDAERVEDVVLMAPPVLATVRAGRVVSDPPSRVRFEGPVRSP